MDFTKQVNYQSDFDVNIHFKDADNKVIAKPAFDFLLTFTTTGGNKVEAGQQDGMQRNYKEVEGGIKVVFDNHKLLPGTLNLEARVNEANPDYPDGKKLTVINVPTDITLTANAGEVSSDIDIEVKLPFVVEQGSSSSSEESEGGSSSSSGG